MIDLEGSGLGDWIIIAWISISFLAFLWLLQDYLRFRMRSAHLLMTKENSHDQNVVLADSIKILRGILKEMEVEERVTTKMITALATEMPHLKEGISEIKGWKEAGASLLPRMCRAEEDIQRLYTKLERDP